MNFVFDSIWDNPWLSYFSRWFKPPTTTYIVGLPISNKQTPFLWGRVLGGRVKYTADRPRDDRDTTRRCLCYPRLHRGPLGTLGDLKNPRCLSWFFFEDSHFWRKYVLLQLVVLHISWNKCPFKNWVMKFTQTSYFLRWLKLRGGSSHGHHGPTGPPQDCITNVIHDIVWSSLSPHMPENHPISHRCHADQEPWSRCSHPRMHARVGKPSRTDDQLGGPIGSPWVPHSWHPSCADQLLHAVNFQGKTIGNLKEMMPTERVQFLHFFPGPHLTPKKSKLPRLPFFGLYKHVIVYIYRIIISHQRY